MADQKTLRFDDTAQHTIRRRRPRHLPPIHRPVGHFAPGHAHAAACGHAKALVGDEGVQPRALEVAAALGGRRSCSFRVQIDRVVAEVGFQKAHLARNLDGLPASAWSCG